MPYSGPQDITTQWPKAMTLAGALTPEEIEPVIIDSDGFINARLAARYQVPFGTTPANTPPIIRTLSKYLTLVALFDRSQNTPAWVLRVEERATDLLTALSDGTLQLVDASGNIIAARTDIGNVMSTTDTYIPTFGIAPSINQTVDPQRADDEDQARRQ